MWNKSYKNVQEDGAADPTIVAKMAAIPIGLTLAKQLMGDDDLEVPEAPPKEENDQQPQSGFIDRHAGKMLGATALGGTVYNTLTNKAQGHQINTNNTRLNMHNMDLDKAAEDRTSNSNLIAINKEKKQSNGGRLDILLKDKEDNSMYEVEVMLGKTDPSHIIRAIEYWDNEKRKYPQRQHFCVLIAESFDRRYFNVIQLMSLNIPMIAIQADLLEVNKEKILRDIKTDVQVLIDDIDTNIGKIRRVIQHGWMSKPAWIRAIGWAVLGGLIVGMIK